MSADVRINTASYAVIMAAFDLDMPGREVLAASTRLTELFDARAIGVAAAGTRSLPISPKGRSPKNTLPRVKPICASSSNRCTSNSATPTRMIGSNGG